MIQHMRGVRDDRRGTIDSTLWNDLEGKESTRSKVFSAVWIMECRIGLQKSKNALVSAGCVVATNFRFQPQLPTTAAVHRWLGC